MKIILNTLCICAVLSCTASAGELLTNGDFASSKLAPWKLFTKPGQPAATSSVEEGVLKISPEDAASTHHERQLMQSVTVDPEKKYVLTFEIKTTSGGGEEMVVVLARTKFFSKGHYGLFRKFTPGAEWEAHKLTFTTKTIDADDPPALKFNLGMLTGDVYLRNVSLTPEL